VSDPDTLLADLWAQDEPPARDPAFVLAAMERIEQRRFWLGLLSLAPPTLAASLILWALAPVLGVLMSALPGGSSALAPLAAALVMALFLWTWASDRLQPLDA
jgi:hypothetical protein